MLLDRVVTYNRDNLESEVSYLYERTGCPRKVVRVSDLAELLKLKKNDTDFPSIYVNKQEENELIDFLKFLQKRRGGSTFLGLRNFLIEYVS